MSDKSISDNLRRKKLLTKKELNERIISKLGINGTTDIKSASDKQLYIATVQAIKDILIDSRRRFQKRVRATRGKKICYMCMEFLIGRSLKATALSLGIYKDLCNILRECETSFDRIAEYEKDPGLGNGGLGRLAACFLDSLTSLDYYANGYSLLYETGLFKQKIIDGEQIELPDEWLDSGSHWLVAHPEQGVTVKFGGKIEEKWDNGQLKIIYTDYDEVVAIPFDLLIPGDLTNATNKIRLWKAGQIEARAPYQPYNSSDSIITKQLYPKDEHDEGKLLRLTQQYLLVSASLQSIISDYFKDHGSLSGFCENVSIHINDTHPALCIPELMRILMDIYSYSWDDAWSEVIKCISYTNHTVLPEALECWRVDLFSVKLPRIYAIIKEINERFTKDLWTMYPGDWDRISRMSIIAYNQIRMANLSVIASHKVNGVSRLHSDILKKSVFHDFYKLTPWKFTSITNGISHRRWLISANPELCVFLDELIGKDYRKDPLSLEMLMQYENDKNVYEKLLSIKKINKERLAKYVYEKTTVKIDTNSFFDAQIKRMHEYKRQLLNVLKIISLYNEIIDGRADDIPPQTFIFGCKAAPGYTMAKRLISLIIHLSNEIKKNKAAREKINIVFLEDYNVSIAEILIPSVDLSEQISLAGKEASGTGCMKLMMNGAITIGTLDGANPEILEAVGRENAYIFGMNAGEAEMTAKNGYNPRSYYHSSATLKHAIDIFESEIDSHDFSFIIDYLLNSGFGSSDPYMCLADFESYLFSYKSALKDWQNTESWSKKSLINIAKSGIFSSDNSIRKYADEIWNATPICRINKAD